MTLQLITVWCAQGTLGHQQENRVTGNAPRKKKSDPFDTDGRLSGPGNALNEYGLV
jgi:hypothetical protein